MDDYISREAALKKLQMQLLDLEADQDKGEYSELCEKRGARDALDEAIYDIRALKTADVQAVKRGRWRMHSDYPDRIICSHCNLMCDAYFCERDAMKYCPNCGARMKEN